MKNIIRHIIQLPDCDNRTQWTHNFNDTLNGHILNQKKTKALKKVAILIELKRYLTLVYDDEEILFTTPSMQKYISKEWFEYANIPSDATIVIKNKKYECYKLETLLQVIEILFDSLFNFMFGSLDKELNIKKHKLNNLTTQVEKLENDIEMLEAQQDMKVDLLKLIN